MSITSIQGNSFPQAAQDEAKSADCSLQMQDTIANKSIQRSPFLALAEDEAKSEPMREMIANYTKGYFAKIPLSQDLPLPNKDLPPAYDWKEAAQKQAKILTDNISNFVTLLSLRELTGLEEIDPRSTIDQVQKLKSETSLWSLFINHAGGDQLPFYKKIIAGIFYWALYQTSFISNAVDAYFETFLNAILDKIDPKNPGSRTKLWKGLLVELSDFFIKDQQAALNFVAGKTATLDECQKEAIRDQDEDAFHDFCQFFVENQLENLCFKVPILPALQELPLLGYIFQLFERLVNYLLTQQVLPRLLPKATKSAIQSALKAVGPDRVLFHLDLLRFVNKKLEKLINYLVPEGKKTDELDLYQAPEALEPLLKAIAQTLRLSLQVEGLKEVEELQKGIALIQAPNRQDAINYPYIEQGIALGGRLLFGKLDEMLYSYELLFHILDKTCTLFENENKSQETLQEEYKQERENIAKRVQDLVTFAGTEFKDWKEKQPFMAKVAIGFFTPTVNDILAKTPQIFNQALSLSKSSRIYEAAIVRGMKGMIMG
jgi:hypothetical protein